MSRGSKFVTVAKPIGKHVDGIASKQACPTSGFNHWSSCIHFGLHLWYLIVFVEAKVMELIGTNEFVSMQIWSYKRLPISYMFRVLSHNKRFRTWGLFLYYAQQFFQKMDITTFQS
jgi:hypothetical protein